MKSIRFVKNYRLQKAASIILGASISVGMFFITYSIHAEETPTPNATAIIPFPSEISTQVPSEPTPRHEKKVLDKNPSLVVESQVSAKKDKKDLEITNPSESTLTESIKVLTPEWIQPFFEKYRDQFSRPLEGTGIINQSHVLDAAEKERIISRLNKDMVSDIKTVEVDSVLNAIGKKNFSLGINIKRIYFPKDTIPSAQAFREKILITAPQALASYGWLTFRFYNEPFDRSWIYSPLTKKTRPISPLLRSESLFYSAFAADDIFGFSENTLQLEPTIGDSTVRLTLSEHPAGQQIIQEGPCETVDDAQKDESNKKEVKISVPKTSLVPRETVSIAFLNKDPFGNYGKVTVIVDRETGAPSYKLVESRDGKILRMVVHSRAWTWAMDRTEGEAILSYKKIVRCKENQYQWDTADFDPVRLGPS